MQILRPLRFRISCRSYSHILASMNVHNSSRLQALEVDHLFHLGLDTSMPLQELFGKVKCVVMSGGRERAKTFAARLQKTFTPEAESPPEPIGSTSRYCLYLVGEFMSVSHGMGGPSISILLVELTKLFFHAKAQNVIYIRTGTSGGIGVAPGTVVISDKVYNEGLEPVMETFACGKKQRHPTTFTPAIAEALYSLRGDLPAVIAGTVSCNSYYDGQGRLDGISASYNEDDRITYLNACHAKGIRNMEMEGLV